LACGSSGAALALGSLFLGAKRVGNRLGERPVLRSGELAPTIGRCQRITLPRGHGSPPGAAATGQIAAVAMYAGESAAAVPAVDPVAQVIRSWCAAVEQPG
jgi:hypothetical protein